VKDSKAYVVWRSGSLLDLDFGSNFHFFLRCEKKEKRNFFNCLFFSKRVLNTNFLIYTQGLKDHQKSFSKYPLSFFSTTKRKFSTQRSNL